MHRALAATALLLLFCPACATVEGAPTDTRLVEAQSALDEGQRLRDEGRYAEAVPLAERALALREAVFGETHPEAATCLNLLGDLHRRQGAYARAEPLLQRALAVREAALGENHSSVAASLNNLAILYADQGLHARAGPLYERALAIRQATLGENHPTVAALLSNLATLYHDQGHYARAEPLYERALAIRQEALGQDHPDVAASLNNLATLYADQGFYARAEPLYERALAIRQAALGEDHPLAAASLNNLATLYMDQGLHARAEPLYERTLAIWEATLGEEHPHTTHALNNLATLYKERGLYARAEPLYERALALRKASLGEHHPAVAASLNDLAILYMEQGLYARAGPLYERALAIKRASLGEHHPDTASTLSDLAGLYHAQGLQARAGPLYERALELLETALGERHPHVATLLARLAQLRLAQQRTAEALLLYERAFTSSEEHLRQEALGFSEARLAGALNLLREQEDFLYSLARAYPGGSRARHLALSAALLRKGRSVEELAETSRIIYRGLGETDRGAFERLRALRTQFSTLSLSGPDALSPAEYQQRLKELAAEGDALEVELSQRSAPLRALSSLPPPGEIVQRVAQNLPGDGALVEFVAYHDRPLVPEPGTPPSQAPQSLRYLALLLFADGGSHAVDLGPAGPIDSAALRLHEALAERAGSYRSAAQALHKLVFRPLVPHLGNVRHLFLSPDGQLALVPFAALHDGRRFLVDSLDITYLTSGKDLLPRPGAPPPAQSLVVLADPDFGSPPAVPPTAAQATPGLMERSASLERFFSPLRSELADQPWAPLPGTRKEAEAIHRLFPQARLLLGRAATKHALLNLETPGILHIATHGFLLEDAAAPPATRAVGHFGAVGEAGPRLRPADPLLRSGLVLAGARSQQAQDGSPPHGYSLVTALELAGLNLWGTQLVVLSACDTGRGDVKLGQGVYGLRRALVVAGAESLVTSLWKVNDEVTRQLMELYYRHLFAGQGRSAALHHAMRALRKKHPHPHFWAPFLPIGQAGPLPELRSPARE